MSLSLGHVTTTLYGKTGGKKCVDMVKNLDMERLSWVIQVDPWCKHRNTCKKKSEAAKEAMWPQRQRSRDAATSQRQPAAPRSWKRPGLDRSSWASRESTALLISWFLPMILILDFWLPKPQANNFRLFKTLSLWSFVTAAMKKQIQMVKRRNN